MWIPPKDDEKDYNPEIEQMIEDMLFESEEQAEESDDLKDINIG